MLLDGVHKIEISEELRQIFGESGELIRVGGAITTRKLYENWEIGFAQIEDDGAIYSHGEIIGHRDSDVKDLERLVEYD